MASLHDVPVQMRVRIDMKQWEYKTFYYFSSQTPNQIL